MNPRSYELFIDGKWTPGKGDGVIDVIDPATEEWIGQVSEGGVDEATRAVAAARKAFDDGPWPYMEPRERSRILTRFADVLESRKADLNELLIAETGCLPWLADVVQVGGAIESVRYNAEAAVHEVRWTESAPPRGGPTVLTGEVIVREPVGVVAAITPFNFPFFLNLVKVVPALAVGCTVVLKPHPWTPMDAFEIARAAEEAGVPPGVLNVITGGAEVGNHLTSDPGVDMVTFTGSTPTGRAIMASASDTVKKLQLELGGKSARIVLDDITEDDAAALGFGAALVHSGQGCELQTRLLLPESLLEPFLVGLREQAAAISVGDPREPGTTVGPLIREAQRERVESYVAAGVAEGAEVAVGGQRTAGKDKGFFYDPTVLIGCRNDMRVCQEEIFGPVLTVVTYNGEDEAVRIANDSIYGLSGGVVSSNTARAFNVARQIRSGKVGVTTTGVSGTTDNGPGHGQGPGWGPIPSGAGISGAFGGYKQSGVGREWGRSGLEEFTELKWISWS
jgi:aldehyde dehydrogenase (NAD+)